MENSQIVFLSTFTTLTIFAKPSAWHQMWEIVRLLEKLLSQTESFQSNKFQSENKLKVLVLSILPKICTYVHMYQNKAESLAWDLRTKSVKKRPVFTISPRGELSPR
jgi:hypothetical protein